VDSEAIINSLIHGKAELVITGKTSLLGEALSPDIATFISIQKNVLEKCWLITINFNVNGLATKVFQLDGEKYRGNISISEDILVFTNPEKIEEIEHAISSKLKTLIDKIISDSSAKPKFYLVL
jgi:hypothetical protein